jgi:hypothetical protein
MSDPQPTLTRRRAIGVHPGDKVSPEAVRNTFPGVTHTRPFIHKSPNAYLDDPREDSLVRRVERACTPSWDAEMVPVYSFKLHPGQVAEGRWDGQVRELAAWHIGRKPALAVLWHEPEDNFTGENYRDYFNHLARVMRAENDKLPLVYAAMAYHWAPGGNGGSIEGRTDETDGWNAVEADLRCCDVYSGKSFELELTLDNHPGFQRWLRRMVPDGRYGITERGFSLKNNPNGQQVRAQKIEEESAWLSNTEDGRRCSMYLYWNTKGSSYELDERYGIPAVRKLVGAVATTPDVALI